MIIGTFDKAPEEREPYEIDLKPALNGERVQNVVWTSSMPLELEVGESFINDPVIRVWLSGGRAGRDYSVTAHVRTSGGRELVRGFKVRVTDDHALTAPAKGLSAVEPTTTLTVPAPTLSEADVALRVLTRTAISTAIVLPTLWVGGRAFKVKGLTGWRLVGISFSISGALTLGSLLIEALRKK